MTIKKITTDQMKKRTSKIEWSKVDVMTDEDIAQAIVADPDAYEMTDEQLALMRPLEELPELHALVKRGRPPKDQLKLSTTIRLDAEIISFLRFRVRAGKLR